MKGSTRRAKAEARSKEVGLLYDELAFQLRRMSPGIGVDGSLLNAQTLKQIDQLAIRMEEDECPPITIIGRHSGSYEFQESPIGHELIALRPWMPARLPSGVHLSQRVEVFIEQHSELAKSLPGSYLVAAGGPLSKMSLDQANWFNTFASAVKANLRNPIVQRSIRAAESSVEKRYQDACAYVDSLFQKAPDLLLITMELSLAPTLTGAFGVAPDLLIHLPGRGGVDKQQLKIVANVQEFLAKGRHRKALSNMVGFMGRWSRSEEKGTFARVVFFLDGSRVADANEAAIAIGQEWISKYSVGLGTFDVTCLSRAEEEMSLLPVRIGRWDIIKRRALQENVILYMTKLGLVYKDTSLQVRSHFFRGELPAKKRKSSSEKTYSL